MSVGLHKFRLPPRDFWNLSLPEWRALTAPPSTASPLSRSEFDRLLSQHPD